MSITYKWLFNVLLMHLVVISSLMAQQTADIRQVRWGFSPKEVQQTESLKPSKVRRDKIVYAHIPLANRTVGLEYEFNGDSLLSASYYYYTTASITQAEVMSTSTELEGLLSEKYGSGKVVQVGELRTVNWLTPRTQIRLALGNINRGWSLEITYLCRICSGPPQIGTLSKNNWKARKDIKDL